MLVALASVFAAPAAAVPVQGEPLIGVRTVNASQFGTAQKPVRISSDDGSFPTGRVYCTRTYRKPGCLTPLSGQVEYLGIGEVSLGGDVEIKIDNPNRKQAPRDIAVFVLRDEGNGPEFVEIFGDRDWVPGCQWGVQYESTLRFTGLSDGTYRIAVGWADQRLEFFYGVFTVEGASDEEPPPPPLP